MDCCSPPGSSVHGQVASDMSSNKIMVRISGVLNNRLGTHTHTHIHTQRQHAESSTDAGEHNLMGPCPLTPDRG